VPYVVAIECSDGALRFRRISCRDADKIAVRFLKALRVAGGTPRAQPDAISLGTLDRPAEESSVFTYHSPGDLLAGTGLSARAVDYTVYSKCAPADALAPLPVVHELGTARDGTPARSARAYRRRVNG
jgi:hypothetical protein